jgi:hypothetical protein
VVQREKGKDVIVEYRCQCQVPVGYISLSGLPNVRDVLLNINIKGMKEAEKVLYLLSDALVLDAKNALVFAELSEIKFEK